MADGNLTPQRPALPPSPEIGRSSGSIASRRSSRINLRARGRQMPPTPEAENDSAPGLVPTSRRVLNGRETRSLPNEDDETGNVSREGSGGIVYPSLGAPVTRTTADSQLSTVAMPATPSPLPRRFNSAPAIIDLSNPGEISSPLSPQGLDLKIADSVRKPLPLSQIRNGVKGNNYVFTILDLNGQEKKLVKVGFSTSTTTRRQSQIQQNCKLLIRQELNPNQRPIRLHRRAEDLIKAELEKTKHEFDCEHCRVKHTEYFTAPADVALEVTQRWTGFCEKEPWDENGKLHPFWDRRLPDIEACSDDEDHARRAERWSWFVNASWWDRAKYNVNCVGESAWPHRWQLVCSLQTVYLVCVTFPDAWAILVGWVLHVFIFFDMMFSDTQLITMFSQGRTLIHKRTPSKNADPFEGGGDFTVSEDVGLHILGDDEIPEPQENPRQEMDIG